MIPLSKRWQSTSLVQLSVCVLLEVLRGNLTRTSVLLVQRQQEIVSFKRRSN